MLFQLRVPALRATSVIRLLVIASIPLIVTAVELEQVPPTSPIASPASSPENLQKILRFTQQLAIRSTGPVLRWVPRGEFMMGDSRSRPDVSAPAHRVILTRSFFLGTTEVTQAQWIAVMGNNPSRFQGDNLPVETVSWEDAMAFCRKLTEQEKSAGRLPEGWEFNLPTEAQWEFACRAGTTDDSSSTNLDALSWHVNNSEGEIHAVGTKLPNAWGFSDLHGNVWEWCRDLYTRYPQEGGAVWDPEGPAPEPRGATARSGRVVRGGSWNDSPNHAHSAFRASVAQSSSKGFGRGLNSSSFGFRLALVRVD